MPPAPEPPAIRSVDPGEANGEFNGMYLGAGVAAAFLIMLVIFAVSGDNQSPSANSNSSNSPDALASGSDSSEEQLSTSQASGIDTGSASPDAPAPSTPQTLKLLDASGNLSPSVITLIEPSVVEISCYSADESTESSGSGVSYMASTSGVHLIMTNYHVYAGAIVGGQQPTCFAVFPQPPDFSYNGYFGDYPLTLSDRHFNPSTYEDAALFTLAPPLYPSVPTPIPVIEDAFAKIGVSPMQCPDSDASVGDSVTIFGYPTSGNALGISETVTEGIVSGILPGPIYKTNAAIDHGNSGGVAILNKAGCALGIPTLGASGLTAGIGYIQSFSLVNAAVN